MIKKTNRIYVLIGALLLQICIGAIYSWSLFNQPLAQKYGWQESEIVFTFAITVFTFAFATMFSGRLQDKLGPKTIARIGGTLYGIGLVLSSTATTLAQLYLFYGVIVGLGVGFVYVCPLSTCLKWFPERKGLITGVSLGAFGSGSLIFKSVIEYLLSNYGVSSTFLSLGFLFFLIIMLGAQFLKVPSPQEFNNQFNKIIITGDTGNFTVLEMVKTKSFIMLWFIFLFGTLSGLLVIGLAKDIGVQLAGLAPNVAADSIAIIALFNTLGRLVLGWMSDKFGRIKVIFVAFIITAASMLSLSFFPLNYFTYMLILAAITFSFGGLLAIYPTITGELYGMKNLGANYGIMFQAYGIAALVGPILAANIGDLKITFIMASALALLGGLLITQIKIQKKVT